MPMSPSADPPPVLGPISRQLVRFRIWIAGTIRIGEVQATLFWAALIGFTGAWISIGFREATDWLHALLTGSHEGFVSSFSAMPWWRRLLVPALGGLFAGLVIHLGGRLKRRENSTDYMEAVVVGEGNLPVRASLIKVLSAWFSGSSGASIGREGPLVQLAALGGSILGRWLDFPLSRKRQIVACGAAAGIASAYNAPISGAFFVAEIVLGTLAMDTFGPLVVSSFVAVVTCRSYLGPEALYAAPAFAFTANRELLPYLALGGVCGAGAAAFLWFLKHSELAFNRLRLPAWARLTCGGLLVGAMSLIHPEVAGNGRSLVFGILHHPGTWQALAIILVFKVAATGATFGSGAVGGVFTPTLFTGSALGYLYGILAAWCLPAWNLDPGAFGLVGMGAFLAASTGAPVMAIVMIFELTLNYQILIPVVLSALTGYYICRAITPRSLYAEALARKGASVVARHLTTLGLRDLIKEDRHLLSASASFGMAARQFLQSRHDFLHVEENGRYIGAIALQDIRLYLDQKDLETLLVAKDLVHEDHPALPGALSLAGALKTFVDSGLDRLPVIGSDGRILGVVGKKDVLLLLTGVPEDHAATGDRRNSLSGR